MPVHYKGKTGAARVKAVKEHKVAMKQKKYPNGFLGEGGQGLY